MIQHVILADDPSWIGAHWLESFPSIRNDITNWRDGEMARA